MTELLNMDDLQGLSQEELQAKIEEANGKYKDLQSNSDRGVQKVLAEKKLSEKALKSIKEINGDNGKFVELYDSDKELGEYLLKNVFDGASIEDFKEGGDKSVKSEPKLTKEVLNAYYEEKQVEEKIEKVSSKLSEDVRVKFDEEFKDLTDGKKLTKDNVDKYIKIALKEANPDFTNEEQMAKIYSMGSGVSAPKEQSGVKTDKATSDFLHQMGIVTKQAE